MLDLGALEQILHVDELFAVADGHLLELLDLSRELIDDAPSNDLFASEPLTSLQVVSFPEEELDVQQIPELAALEHLKQQAWQQGLVNLNRSLTFVIFQGADESTLVLIDAVIE